MKTDSPHRMLRKIRCSLPTRTTDITYEDVAQALRSAHIKRHEKPKHKDAFNDLVLDILRLLNADW